MKRIIQIIIISLGFVVGLVYGAHYVTAPELALTVAAYCLLSLLVVRSKLGYLLIAVVGLCLGIWRAELNYQNVPSYDYNAFIAQKVVVAGTVANQPSWDNQGEYNFELTNVVINGITYQNNLRIKALTGLAKQGNRVSVAGRLWPTLGRTEAGIRYAKVDVLSPTQPPHVRAKEWFVGRIQQDIPKPASDLMIGLLIGERSLLSQDTQDMLTKLGLSHIVAVSGYNLSILAGLLDRLLNGRWRWGGLALSLWGIWGFVFLTGAGASILRAGIMCTIFLVLRYYGRERAVLPALGLCAIVMLTINPTYLWSDLSWQLSFLSLLGIVVITPRIQAILPSRPRLLIELLAVTLAAQLATLGLVAYKFGQISLVAPLANLVVMPAVPPLMFAGLGLVMLGLLVPNLTAPLGNLVGVAISKLIELLNYMASWQYAQVVIIQPSLWQVACYYAMLTAWVLLTSHNPRLASFQSDLKNAIIPGINEPAKAGSFEQTSIESGKVFLAQVTSRGDFQKQGETRHLDEVQGASENRTDM